MRKGMKGSGKRTVVVRTLALVLAFAMLGNPTVARAASDGGADGTAMETVATTTKESTNTNAQDSAAMNATSQSADGTTETQSDAPAQVPANNPAAIDDTTGDSQQDEPADDDTDIDEDDQTNVVETGWGTLGDGRVCYRDEDGNPVTGEQQLPIADSETGELAWFYFDDDGALVTGWHEWDDGTRSYFEPTDTNEGHALGSAHEGWIKDEGKLYYLDPENKCHTARGEKEVNGKTYDFDDDTCAMTTGWQIQDDNKWTYAKADGAECTGWQYINKKWYYFDPDTRRALSGCEREIKGKVYGFNASCAMMTGWHEWADGSWSYFDKDGAAASGWKLINKKWYYFAPEENCHCKSGEQEIKGKNYFFDKNCAMITGWHKWSDGTWSWYGSDGAQRTGWQYIDKKWYYLDSDTARAVSDCELEIKGKTYLFDKSCAMVTGWHKWDDGSWSWYDEKSGAKCTGWVKVKGLWYYLDPDTARALSNCELEIKGKIYRFRPSCAMVSGWYKWSDGTWSYYGTDGAWRKGWQKVGGKWYYLDPNTEHAVAVTGQQTIKGKTYYFDDSCAMISGWHKWNDGTWSYFDSNGQQYFGKKSVSGYTFDFGTTGKIKPVNGKIGYQNPSGFYQVSANKVRLPSGAYRTAFSYVTPPRITVYATRSDCVNAFLRRARQYKGTPYVWNYSRQPGVGVDCIGLVYQCAYACGMNLGEFNPWDHWRTGASGWHSHDANNFWNYGKAKRVSLKSRQPGDLIFWPGHVAIYMGNDRIIEAWPGTGVHETSLWAHGTPRGCKRLFQ